MCIHYSPYSIQYTLTEMNVQFVCFGFSLEFRYICTLNQHFIQMNTEYVSVCVSLQTKYINYTRARQTTLKCKKKERTGDKRQQQWIVPVGNVHLSLLHIAPARCAPANLICGKVKIRVCSTLYCQNGWNSSKVFEYSNEHWTVCTVCGRRKTLSIWHMSTLNGKTIITSTAFRNDNK